MSIKPGLESEHREKGRLGGDNDILKVQVEDRPIHQEPVGGRVRRGRRGGGRV